MAVKTRSKATAQVATAPVSFPRLAYSAPSPEELIGAQVRRFTLPATKSLPFVRLRANDQPLTRPESYWHVRPSGKTRHDREVGRQYARAAIAAMKTDQDSSLVAHILQDVIADAVARSGRKAGNRRNAVTHGFLSELSLALAATP
jgi:hypothetical protein